MDEIMEQKGINTKEIRSKIDKENELIRRLERLQGKAPEPKVVEADKPQEKCRKKKEGIDGIIENLTGNKDRFNELLNHELGEERDERKDNYEFVNHPDHYNGYDIEVIDMMVRIWGYEATIMFCLMNAYKYRMRLGMKPGVSIEQDLAKEKWYKQKAKELKSELFDKQINGSMNN